LEAGRVDWLHRRGVRYEEWARRGIHLPVIELRLRYRKVARFDEVLVVESSRRELRPATVRFTHRILRGEDVICDAETLLTCVGNDLDLKVFPDEALAVFESPETSSPPFP
jgi:acyl-CoA thioester hydrolase